MLGNLLVQVIRNPKKHLHGTWFTDDESSIIVVEKSMVWFKRLNRKFYFQGGINSWKRLKNVLMLQENNYVEK